MNQQQLAQLKQIAQRNYGADVGQVAIEIDDLKEADVNLQPEGIWVRSWVLLDNDTLRDGGLAPESVVQGDGVTATADDEAYMQRLGIVDGGVRARTIMERAVIRQAAKDLLAAGFQLRVWNGGAYECQRTDNLATIMASIGACDEESLVVYQEPMPRHLAPPGPLTEGWTCFGTILLVYGNEGWSVIADNSGNVEQYLAGATALSQRLQDLADGEAIGDLPTPQG